MLKGSNRFYAPFVGTKNENRNGEKSSFELGSIVSWLTGEILPQADKFLREVRHGKLSCELYTLISRMNVLSSVRQAASAD